MTRCKFALRQCHTPQLIQYTSVVVNLESRSDRGQVVVSMPVNAPLFPKPPSKRKAQGSSRLGLVVILVVGGCLAGYYFLVHSPSGLSPSRVSDPTAGASSKEQVSKEAKTAPSDGSKQQQQQQGKMAQAGSQETAQVAPFPLEPSEAGLKRIVIVGGGLAGCAAALAAQAELAAQGRLSETQIVLIEKMPKIGGNSAKASSGINALNPAGGDSQELFEQDTLKSGGGHSKPELVSTLVVRAGEGLMRWLGGLVRATRGRGRASTGATTRVAG